MPTFIGFSRSGEHSEVAQPPMPMVYVRDDVKYEYKQLTRDLKKESAPDEDELNALGEDGWQMAGVYLHEHSLTMIFQRQK